MARWLPFSPALLILPFPGLFRFTCYYYRGAYYKAFWADPPACAVGEPRKSYLGENFFHCSSRTSTGISWVALVFIAFLSWDVAGAVVHRPVTGQKEFGIGLGTILLAANVVLLACYTWGCHVLRHVVGGRMDEVSKSPTCDFVRVRDQPERAAPAVRMVQPVLGDVLGPVCAPVLDGRHHRSEDSLMVALNTFSTTCL